jgi:hypothetical protein
LCPRRQRVAVHAVSGEIETATPQPCARLTDTPVTVVSWSRCDIHAVARRRMLAVSNAAPYVAPGRRSAASMWPTPVFRSGRGGGTGTPRTRADMRLLTIATVSTPMGYRFGNLKLFEPITIWLPLTLRDREKRSPSVLCPSGSRSMIRPARYKTVCHALGPSQPGG